ncbi:MAG TPA: hypothetical protein VGO79_04615 [Thermoanaerobaculia bacterium]
MDHATRVLRALGDFLARYGIYLGIWILIIVSNVMRFRGWRRTSRVLLESPLTSEWSSSHIAFSGEVQGLWQGRPATLRSIKRGRSGRDVIEATLGTSTSGRFLIERGGSSVLTRPLHVGAPPRVEPRDPADGAFSIRSADRTLTDRLLSDSKAREAIAGAVAEPGDRVSLENGRFVARRAYPRSDPPEPAAGVCLTAVREMARVLG